MKYLPRSAFVTLLLLWLPAALVYVLKRTYDFLMGLARMIVFPFLAVAGIINPAWGEQSILFFCNEETKKRILAHNEELKEHE